MRLSASRDQGLGPRVGAGQSQHLVSRVDQLPDNRGTDETPCPCDEHPRVKPPFRVRHVVEILHAHDLGKGLGLSELSGGDVAQTDMADQPLTFKLGEHTQRLLDRSVRRVQDSAHSKVHDVQSVDAEIS